MRFEWDENKNKINQIKHGISFEEAKAVFNDPLHIALSNERFSYLEERWITLGNTRNGKLLVVANVYFDIGSEEIIRIISAREATKNEQTSYERYGR